MKMERYTPDRQDGADSSRFRRRGDRRRAAAAIDAEDEGNAADPPGSEQGGEDELAEVAPAGSVDTLLQQILAGQQLHQQQTLALQKQQQPPIPQ